MSLRLKIVGAVQAVPVFVKIMGIAVGLTVFYGVGSFWQIHSTRIQMMEQERANPHPPAELAIIEEHVARETSFLYRRLARVLSVMALAGIALAWSLTKILTHPIEELVALTRRIQQGDFSARAPVHADDEIGDLATAFNDMTATLEQKEIIRQKLLRRAIEAGEEERQRLARELHDQTGQLLTALIAGLGALETRATDDGQRASLVSLRELAAQTLGDIHNVSRALRPAALDDLGLIATLEKHCAIVADRVGKPVEFHHDGWDDGGRLPSEIEVALYRIVQEALTNAVRHADAARIQVLVQRKAASVMVAVEDDGRGFATGQRHPNGDRLGLLGIEERATLLGGHACLESTPGGGTQLFVEVPVPPS